MLLTIVIIFLLYDESCQVTDVMDVSARRNILHSYIRSLTPFSNAMMPTWFLNSLFI